MARKVVFSNASRAHAHGCSAQLQLRDAFEVVIGLEDLGYVPKPQPEAFRAALDRVGADAEGSALIDDLRPNLATAEAARPANGLGEQRAKVRRTTPSTTWYAISLASEPSSASVEPMFAGFGLYVHIPTVSNEVPVLRLQRAGRSIVAGDPLRRGATRRDRPRAPVSAVRGQATGDDLSRRRYAVRSFARFGRARAREPRALRSPRPILEISLEATPRLHQVQRSLGGYREAGSESTFHRHRVLSRSRPEASRAASKPARRPPRPCRSRASGFANVNVDLMFAIPGQSSRRLARRPRAGDRRRPRACLRLQPDL